LRYRFQCIVHLEALEYFEPRRRERLTAKLTSEIGLAFKECHLDATRREKMREHRAGRTRADHDNMATGC
jgi:hypothetical protein